jgi:hypothetical protein
VHAIHVTRRVYNILKLQGFLETKPVVPLDFFPYETITGDVNMNLPDANRMVLGSSMPISCNRLPGRKLTSQLF